MDPAADLTAWLDHVAFTGLTTDQVTSRLIDEIAAWGAGHGWRVYRRAPSVVPLPPPMENRFSVLDVACARPDGPPLAIEVDHTDRGRTLAKLRAEADAGRVALWVRWGRPPFTEPGDPIRLVPLEVTRSGKLHRRLPERPPPAHSGVAGIAEAQELAIPLTGGTQRRPAAPDGSEALPGMPEEVQPRPSRRSTAPGG